MILALYLSLLALSIVAIALGYFTEDQHYSFVGLFFLFLLGVFLFTGQVEYTVGSTVVTSYNYTGAVITSSTTAVTDVQSAFTGTYARWFGVLLSVSAGFGLALSLYNFRLKAKATAEEAS